MRRMRRMRRVRVMTVVGAVHHGISRDGAKVEDVAVDNNLVQQVKEQWGDQLVLVSSL